MELQNRDFPSERASRIQKKKEIFAYLDTLPRRIDISTQEIVDLIQESREERTDAILAALNQKS